MIYFSAAINLAHISFPSLLTMYTLRALLLWSMLCLVNGVYIIYSIYYAKVFDKSVYY